MEARVILSFFFINEGFSKLISIGKDRFR